MDDLEKALQEALRHEAAPEGFVEKVLAQAQPAAEPRLSWWKIPALRWSLAALLLAAVAASGNWAWRLHERHIAGERARQQVLLALRITGTKLRHVQEQIAETQSSAGEKE